VEDAFEYSVLIYQQLRFELYGRDAKSPESATVYAPPLNERDVRLLGPST